MMATLKKFVSCLMLIVLFSVLVSCNDEQSNNQNNGPVGKGDKYSITYYISTNDNYLATQTIENQNPTEYYDDLGLVLRDLIVPGYNFKGWYTAQTGGERVNEIPVGATGNKYLYAQWEKVEYTITFDSPDVPIDSITYTVDKETTLTKPYWFGYTFVGWSIDGRIVTSIPAGTTGNITLHANWTSERNKATAVSILQNPDIIEDMENGQFLFIYEIGTIYNVPLGVIEYLGNSEGIVINKTYQYEQSVQEGYASTITNVIANATTKTSSWTLSEEWNTSASATNERDEQIGKTEQKTDSTGSVTGGQYYVSNSSGGATSSSVNSGGSSSTSSKVTTNNSTGINGSYHRESELNTSVDVNVEASISAGYGPVKGEVKAGMGSNVSTHDKETFDLAQSRENSIGTYNESNSNNYWDTSKSSSSNWNTESGYNKSSETSTNEEISKIISQVIYDRYGYSSTEQRGTSDSATESSTQKQENKEEYSSTVEYSVESKSTITREISQSSSASGYYRLITAGTVHVFAVVGYDIATNSYYTYTYSVLDTERHEYLDYSKNNSNFNDCENGIIPFEIPYFVHEYVSGAMASTEGLEVNYETGYVTKYTGTDKNVIIPEYVSVDNGHGSYSAIRIRGIEENAFKGNTEITGVYFSKYISNIPANAFAGCSSLEYVIGYGISSIGENAFMDCSSLQKFTIDEKITVLGSNAFQNVPEIYVTAANLAVANSVIASGAKKAVLDVSVMEGSLDDISITIYDSFDYFALISKDETKTYSNLQITCEAKELFLSNIKLIDNTDTPLTISSERVTLNRFTVEAAPGFAMVLKADTTTVSLYGDVYLDSVISDAVISKNVVFEQLNSNVKGSLKVDGNYLICGSITNDNMLTVENGYLSLIKESEYNSIIQSTEILFDANGGEVNVESQSIAYGHKYGTLPIPTRENYTFLGWYTSVDGGTKISADTVVTVHGNQTLYAHWSPRLFVVTFDANGGYVSTNSMSLTFGEAYGSLPNPTREHYIFNGWYTAPTGGTKVTSSSTHQTNKDITLYAQWTRSTCKITFNANNGTVSTKEKLVECGKTYGTLPVPTRTGYSFAGWYTAVSGGSLVSESTLVNSNSDHTLYARWNIISYKVSWSNISNVTVSVSRTSSPYASATTGTLSNGAVVYYGDVLKITYTAAAGYTLSNMGSSSITVTRNITSGDIYASVKANSYTYNVVYKSSNGTVLGNETITFAFGTTNTINPKTFTGYDTPSAQSVVWNSTSAKTITFTYTPTAVSAVKVKDNAWWWKRTSSAGIKYTVTVECTNRTANSATIKITWTNTISSSYYGYGQYFNMTIGGVSTGKQTIATASKWAAEKNHNGSATKSVEIVITGLSATTTSLSYSAVPSAQSDGTHPSNFSGTIIIPAY